MKIHAYFLRASRLFLVAGAAVLPLTAMIASTEAMRIKNGAFREGSDGMQAWKWTPGTHDVQGRVIQQAGLDQGNVFAISSTQETDEPTSVLAQTLEGIKPGDKYLVSIWAKGKAAGKADLFVGDHKVALPKGSYDWKKIETTYDASTAPADGRVSAGVRIFGKTGDLWVVHLRLVRATDRQGEISRYLEENRKRFQKLQAELKGDEFAQDAYVRMGLAITSFYLNRVETGGPNGLQGLPPGLNAEDEAAQWSLLQMRETIEVLDRTEARLAKLRKGEVTLYERPDLRNGTVTYDSFGFWFTPENGSPRPVVLGGFGHFGESVNDAAVLAELGSTFSQGERGAWDSAPDGAPNATATSMPADIAKKFKEGIRTDMLLSPHYFPKWVIKAYPELRMDPESAKQPVEPVNINHPMYVETISKWISTIVPLMVKCPGLFSFCLSNEPGYYFSGHDPFSRSLWVDYLRKKHGAIEVLNHRYGTSYARFEEVPVPEKDYPKDPACLPAYYDWVRFNQKNVADWHRWMNALVKMYAPDKPTHVKFMMDHFDPRPQAERTHGGVLWHGTDPALIGEFTDLAGTDTVSFIGSNQGRFSFPWQRTELTYDFVHSIRQRPVIDTELHFIIDGHPAESVPPEHLHLVLWLGALHNRTAFVNWIWAEPGVFSTSGCVRLRPASLYGAGQAQLDLNRLAAEIRAVNKAPAQVALLYSPTLLFWQEKYPRTLLDLQAAISFAGYKITFINEKQLADQSYPKEITTLFLPRATHLSDETVANLKRFVEAGGRLVPVGEDNLAFDEYNQPRPNVELPPSIEISAAPAQAGSAIRKALEGLSNPPPPLIDRESKEPAWGVEYRVVDQDGRELISLVNLLADPIRVGFEGKGKMKDLQSEQTIDTSDFTLAPRQSMMLRAN